MSVTDRIRDLAKSAREAERMIGAFPIATVAASDVEALCDVTDAARRVSKDGPWPEHLREVDAALARLDDD